ncbi:MAG: 23S rRNA (uracil(1939)-C(5))-methyltransferase RlmD [Actinomycetia bacterium]|nr:23S rRNA (uracil(1939)-C(5))-methyltransferase RlmD [Actinomycetes bacterium]
MSSPDPRLQKNQVVDLKISGLAFGGKGIAKVDDFVVFVSSAVPGDSVRARVTRQKKHYAEARVEQLLAPSPDRQPARCHFFGRCGGCSWQALDYGVQLDYKARQVGESLEHLGGLHDFELLSIVGMADPWRYRNRADFSVGTADTGAVIGFRPPGRWDTVLPLTECHLLPPIIERVRATVEGWLRDQGLPGWDPRSGTGFARHLLVRSAQQGDEVLVSLVTASEDLPDAGGLVERVRTAHPQVVGVLHAVNGGRAEISSGLGAKTLWGRPYLLERVAGITLKVSVDAFFQTNTLMAHALYGLIAHEAGLEAARSCGRETAVGGGPLGSDRPVLSGRPVVWDLYSGVGSIGLSLAGRAGAVLAIESVSAAIRDSQENATLNHITNAVFLEGEVAKVLREASNGSRPLPAGVDKPDVIIVDPPRAGLTKKATACIGETGASRIVYVSCNPATLAPNAAQLVEHGYRLERVTPVDMFPHTPHVECVASMSRIGAPAPL